MTSQGVFTESVEAFRPYLPQWMSLVTEALAAPLTTAECECRLQIVALQVLRCLLFSTKKGALLLYFAQILVRLALKFPSQLAPFLNTIVPQVWNSLVATLKLCANTCPLL